MKASQKIKLLTHIAKDWEEKKHPRYPAGSPLGGQFINVNVNKQASIQQNKKLTKSEVKEEYSKAAEVLDSNIEAITNKLYDVDWRVKNNAPPPPPPSVEELGAISAYTGIAYYDINRHLRGNPYEDYGLKEEYIAPILKLTVSALSQMPSYTKTVYRGTDLDADILDKYTVGEEITEPAFISTAKEQNLAFYGNTYYIIHPKETNSNCVDIQSVSGLEREAEVLYKPGTKFKVLEKIKGKDLYYGKYKYENIIILEEQ